ncbi:MAG: DUF1553 domain-containing protein [Isosphaeraceae bacterium]
MRKALKTAPRIAALWLAVPLALHADQLSIDYVRDVKPILNRRCVACHGALQQKSRLRLDTAARAVQGGVGGPAIVPGKSDESPLIDAVTGADGLRMPPEAEGEPLQPHEIRLLKAWIDAGASAPNEPDPPDPRAHWAFQPPTSPTLPAVKNQDWVVNPIDAFLAASHEAHALRPSPPAEKSVLVRRVFLDLIGLAPSPSELKSFLVDPSPGAYEKLVDRLLASPQHGERWGRHWMDVWRYSDWDGFGAEVRESQPHIWHWRDWIIESLNADKGYDRMVVEMLAADEAAPGDLSSLRATGYLARSWYKFSRNVWLDSIVEHTSKAFLGLTLNCARCHDHKYDPLAQRDYYRFRAVFEPHEIRTERLPGQADLAKDGIPRVYDARLDATTYLFLRGDEKQPEKNRPLSPGVPPVLGGKGYSVQPVVLPEEATDPGRRPFVRVEMLVLAKKEVEAKRVELAKVAKGLPGLALAETGLAAARANLTAAEARIAADDAKHTRPAASSADLLARLAALAERQAWFLKAEERHGLAEYSLANARKARPENDTTKQALAVAEKEQAESRKALDEARASLAKADGAYTPLGESYPPTSSGRRLALARWIVARENPLAARVAVNHVWMRHFGTPLVPTVTDFGLNGKSSTHPQLLDWLAVEFMNRGWSLKTLHRLIVTSNAYRMQSFNGAESASNLAADPANRFFWRMNPHRLEAEAVRDNVLAAAGSLDLVMGGPDLDPLTGELSGRRSLYFRHAKEKGMTFLKQFDAPNVTACYRRSESVMPQQALALANSKLTLDQARNLSRDLTREVGDSVDANDEFVRTAFLRVLGREPTQEEQTACEHYLLAQTLRRAGQSPSASGPVRRQARADLVHVLFNHNDFLTVR